MSDDRVGFKCTTRSNEAWVYTDQFHKLVRQAYHSLTAQANTVVSEGEGVTASSRFYLVLGNVSP